MTNFPALDVAIGVSFAYFLFSVLATAVTETLSRFTKMRARKMEDWLKAVLSSGNAAGDDQAYTQFMGTPVMKALTQAVGRDPKPGQRPPGYIPATHFVTAALGAGRTLSAAGAGAAGGISRDIDALQGTITGDALKELYEAANGNIKRFRRDAEAWFDDQMERLSGVYRRWSQVVVWITGLVIVLALNANTLRIAQTLWNDPSKRAAIVSQAGAAQGSEKVSEANKAINDLPLPLGWSDGYHGWGWLWAAGGLLITFAAISLGAPFWFDTLSRLSRIRQTGPPPPASNATRSGEGDQPRSLH